MKKELEDFRQETSKLHKQMQELFKRAEQIRRYYKYQDGSSDCSSESFIVDFNNLIGETYGVICYLDKLIEWEEERE